MGVGPSCGLRCRFVELNAQGPRHTVTDMDSYAHDARTIVGHDLAQKIEERTAVKILLVLHDSPPTKSGARRRAHQPGMVGGSLAERWNQGPPEP